MLTVIDILQVLLSTGSKSVITRRVYMTGYRTKMDSNEESSEYAILLSTWGEIRVQMQPSRV